MTKLPTSVAGTSQIHSQISRLRIIVFGYLVRCPLGGLAWNTLQHLRGLALLGHDVYFVEDSDDYPLCYDPVKNVVDVDPTYGLQFASRAFERIGLGDHWAYYDAYTSRWLGPYADRILGICATADLLLNLSGGVSSLRPWLMEIPMRTFIDADPAFTQIRHLTSPWARNIALQHTAFLSVAQNIGLNRSTIPNDGLPWQATRSPVVLDAWPATPAPAPGKFTTVMQWETFPAEEYGGVRYGMKSDSFEPYMNLPERAGAIFELVVGGATTPSTLLLSKGWALRDPHEPTRDPWTYQQYIQQSKAEFSVAKHAFVVSRSGWFSERSACYLATGRPVVIQDTGFSDWLQTGAGVIPFSTPEEALAGIEDINSRYEFHCQAARAIAEEYFDARKVLPRLIECAMNPAPAPTADSIKANPAS